MKSSKRIKKLQISINLLPFIAQTVIIVFVGLFVQLSTFGYGQYRNKIKFVVDKNCLIEPLIISKITIDTTEIFSIDSLKNSSIFIDSVFIDSVFVKKGNHVVEFKTHNENYTFSDTISCGSCFIKYHILASALKNYNDGLFYWAHLSLSLYFDGEKRLSYFSIEKNRF